MNLRRLFVLTASLGLLAACGGGGGSAAPAPAPISSANNPAALSVVDNVAGTGAVAAASTTAGVTYTGWLYSGAVADFKGAQFDRGTFSFRLGAGQVIAGFEQGVTGMRVGGTRTILIPSALGYGTTGQGSIPPNAGLVFTVTLNSVQ